jgi:hypothetical protein
VNLETVVQKVYSIFANAPFCENQQKKSELCKNQLPIEKVTLPFSAFSMLKIYGCIIADNVLAIFPDILVEKSKI